MRILVDADVCPDDLLSRKADRYFCEEFMYAKEHYYAPQE